MKKKIIIFIGLIFILSCKEESPDYSFLDGEYEGNSQLSILGKYCYGTFLKMNIVDNNTAYFYTYCDVGAYYSKKIGYTPVKFEGYHVGKSRVDSIMNRGFKNKVDLSLIDNKTDKEVGYFFRDRFAPSLISFISPLLVSTQKDSLFDYAGSLKK